LQLRIDDQRIPIRVCKDSTVFGRDLILRKSLFIPKGNCGFFSQDFDRVGVGGGWDLVVFDEFHEFFIDHNISEFFIEGSSIRDKGAGHEYVSDN
jgi:hypothetical protein